MPGSCVLPRRAADNRHALVMLIPVGGRGGESRRLKIVMYFIDGYLADAMYVWLDTDRK